MTFDTQTELKRCIANHVLNNINEVLVTTLGDAAHHRFCVTSDFY